MENCVCCQPTVVWLTGLSGSGKSTIGRALTEALSGHNPRTVHLDGDVVRRQVGTNGFSREARDAHVAMVGYAAALLQEQDCHVVVSLISPYDKARQLARSLCTGRFILVHVSTPLEVCAARDPKGLYAKATFGLIPNFTGVTAPYEVPKSPELSVDTSVTMLDEAVDLLTRAVVLGCEGVADEAVEVEVENVVGVDGGDESVG